MRSCSPLRIRAISASRIGSRVRILVTGIDAGTRSTAAFRLALASSARSLVSGSMLAAVAGLHAQ